MMMNLNYCNIAYHQVSTTKSLIVPYLMAHANVPNLGPVGLANAIDVEFVFTAQLAPTEIVNIYVMIHLKRRLISATSTRTQLISTTLNPGLYPLNPSGIRMVFVQ